MRFYLDDVNPMSPCSSGAENANRAYRMGRGYTLEDSVELGVPRDSVFWFVFNRAGTDEAVLELLRAWAVDIGIDPEIAATGGSIDIANAEQRLIVVKVIAMRNDGLDKSIARASVSDEHFAKLLKAFHEE